MATAALKRVTLVRLQLELHRDSIRPFSAAAAAAAEASPSSASATEVKKPSRKKKKNFFEVAQFLAEWGIGSKFHKSHWAPGCFYKITKVKVNKDGRHGKAWGVYHQEDKPKTGDAQKIGGVNKRCWRYIKEGEPALMWKSIALNDAVNKPSRARAAESEKDDDTTHPVDTEVDAVPAPAPAPADTNV